jgi:hypothetical protein
MMKTVSPIQVSGGKRQIQLGWMNGQPFAFANYNQALWNGGETLTVTGGGDTVPAFNAALTAPSQIVLATPLPSTADHVITASPTADLPLTWNRGASGELHVSLTTPTRRAACDFQASIGSASIPSKALAFLGSGNRVQMLTSADSSATTTANDWSITVNATLAPTFADGSIGSAQVMIQ